MRAVLIALFVLVLAVAGVFLGQFFLNPAVISPTGLFSGDGSEGGLITINSTICKDSVGAFTNIRLERDDAFPFDLKGAVCDPDLIDGTQGVGIMVGSEVTILVDGVPKTTATINDRLEFNVFNFHQYLTGNPPWNVDVIAPDALGNNKTTHFQIKKKDTETASFNAGSGTSGSKTAYIQGSSSWRMSEKIEVSIDRKAEVCTKMCWCPVPPIFLCPCPTPCAHCRKSGSAAIVKTAPDSSSSWQQVNGNLCCCRNGNFDCGCSKHSYTYHYYSIKKTFPHQANVSVVKATRKGGEKFDGFKGKVFYNTYEIIVLDDLECGADFTDPCVQSCQEGGFDYGRCSSSSCIDSYCDGNTGYFAMSCQLDVEGCEGYCTCFSEEYCGIGGMRCSESCGQLNPPSYCKSLSLCTSGCNTETDGLCEGSQVAECVESPLNQTFPYCFEDFALRENLSQPGIAFDCNGSQECICYDEQICSETDQVCDATQSPPECVECVEEGENCSTDICCSGLTCEEDVCIACEGKTCSDSTDCCDEFYVCEEGSCKTCFSGMNCTLEEDCCSDFSYCCENGCSADPC